MSADIAVREQTTHSLLARGRALLFGMPLPERLPDRIHETIRREQEQSEILVSVIQLLAIATFAVLYTLAPKGFGADISFEPVPLTLAVYAAFTVIRLWLALTRRLPRWFVSISIVVDVTVLLITIWSFHLQYNASPSLYLKAPTLMYVFILIALRTLRFEPIMVVLTGVTASVGWLLAVVYAVTHQQPCDGMQLLMAIMGDDACNITHMFPKYTTSDEILLGAEFDKIVSMLMVTLILAIALVRARNLLIRATAEHQAAADLSRFFAPEIAGRIRATEAEIKPGDAELRNAAIIMTDLRGFTPLTEKLAPREVMALLSAYQSRVVAAISAEGGSIDKFMGDGILASFGAAIASPAPAAQAMRAADRILQDCRKWRVERKAKGLEAPAVGLAVTTGRVMFGAIGDDNRLEYTVIGEPVNIVAKLEKHTKAEGVGALSTADAYDLAMEQGYRPQMDRTKRIGRVVDGVPTPLDLIVLD
ncbi:MAG: adenylate/guanylate cyclase domain-containing protein [Alphaproteobacteria bacterium]|nr:adenylate/guanylate cyclase domain-containing protein [Alphaproteobacteria bacterium]